MQTIYFYSEEKKQVETLNFDSINGVNVGLCHNRLQLNKPCFFVSFDLVKKGRVGRHYQYFAFRFMADALHTKLKRAQIELAKNAITA
jgi:hypothetical protein